MPIHACTIVANNYLAYARVFCRSLLDRHPDARVFVLLVDRPHPGIDAAAEPFTPVWVEELGIPGFASLAFRSSLLELSTAVKPFFLEHLHRRTGCERLFYFDPDILVTGDLDGLEARLGTADALLTPHLGAPLDDDAIPSERDILLSGVYNLGFLGLALNDRTLPFLAWWQRRLARDCRHQVERGLFVDQRWMDLAPAFLARAEILHHPGCNLAYWNLAHRALESAEPAAEGWRVRAVSGQGADRETDQETAPLLFAHFSGIDAERPEEISRYQNRFTLGSRPDLAPLWQRYAERLLAAGHRELAGIPYAFRHFADGTPIPQAARAGLWLLDPQGLRWADPFAAGPGSFLAWLRQPAVFHGRYGPRLPRFALLLWDLRPDLQLLFSHPVGEHLPAFVEWWLTEARKEGIPDTLLTPEGVATEAPADGPDGPEERFTARLAETPAVPVSTLWEDLAAPDRAWLAADPAAGLGASPHLPRLALRLHALRGDLQRAFPDPLGASRAVFARWLLVDGRAEYRLPEWALAPVRRTLPWHKRLRAAVAWWRRLDRWQAPSALPADRTIEEAPARSEPRSEPEEPSERASHVPPGVNVIAWTTAPTGVNVIGWSTAPTGVGEACRGTLAALAEAGLPHAVWPLSERPPAVARAVGEDAGAAGLPYGVSLFHVNADQMDTIARALPRSAACGVYRIGCWFWELSHLPLGVADAFSHVDEVWAPSRFCQDSFRVLAPVEVRLVPPCVPIAAASPADRAAFGIPADAFLVYSAFDALSVPERKNPEGLLAAFGRAVRDSPVRLHLLLKVRSTATAPGLAERLARQAAGLPVTLLDRTLAREEMAPLATMADAYLALHRSEGLGLPLIEALGRDKPVVATGYGGVTDFLDEQTGWPVRYRLIALDRPCGPYPRGAVWAEPDPEHAAACLLEVATDPEAARRRAEAGRVRVQELYSPPAAAARLRAELERIKRLRSGTTGA